MESYIDAHVHCGKTLVFENYISITDKNIGSVVAFSPVSEIYDRKDQHFKDSEEWQKKRRESNIYVLNLNKKFNAFPFFFVWNDFPIEQLEGFLGIKWHRHWGEPRYEYDSNKCKEFIQEIEKRNLPVILEEEFNNTLFFINELARKARVIIPHLGMLNGGYDRFCEEGIWKREHIFADTALAEREDIKHYVKNYGCERIFFGSDFPFGAPGYELSKVLNLRLGKKVTESITRENILKLLESVKN